MNIAILGTGIYGLAIASILAKNKHNITMWSESKEKIQEYNQTKNLKTIAPNYKLPKNIKVVGDYEKALKDAEIVFICSGSKFVDKVTNDIKDYINSEITFCIASKGLDENTGSLLSDILRKNLNTKNICVISGPTFAVDILNNEPVALALASTNKTSAQKVYDALNCDFLKLRMSKDIIGVQICGSVKNIIAIASGILGGLGYSESTQAFLINESLHDIKHLIKYMGGKPKTILSFAGVGDLLMTSMSKKSRNYSFGEVIGRTNDINKINDFLDTHTVEGYFTLKTVVKLLEKKNIDIPIIYLINDIVDGKIEAKELAEFLINKK